jgi:hypothetical protein
MLLATETEARLNWLVRPNRSSTGNEAVSLYISTVIWTDRCHTKSSLNESPIVHLPATSHCIRLFDFGHSKKHNIKVMAR